MPSNCTYGFGDCFSSREAEQTFQRPINHGVEREMKVSYQQPHLVEPMKLRVYEDLPSTPVKAQHTTSSQWNVFPQRNVTSTTASTAVRFSLKKVLFKSSASRVTTFQPSHNDMLYRGRQQYRPLELSIYIQDTELPDLPAFDRLSFTECGELKKPPKAVIRTRSVQLPEANAIIVTSDHKPVSMYEVCTTALPRPSTACSGISRPPSEYDALHSHPVSWASLPGLPISNKTPHKVECSMDILTPMQEEFSPEPTTILVDDIALRFPDADPRTRLNKSPSPRPSIELQAPYPVVSRGPARAGRSSSQAQENTVPPYFHTNYQTQKRISQWLSHRAHSSSTSTTRSTSTTNSFAEHRRKRSQFYQLRTTQTTPPASLRIATNTPPRRAHQRVATTSTVASTVDTDVLSEDFSDKLSDYSMTTVSRTDLKSRAGTIKSVASPGGYKITVTQARDLGISPSLQADIHHIEEEREDDDSLFVKEIGGPLRSPGVGIAF